MKILIAICVLLLLCGCAPSQDIPVEEPIQTTEPTTKPTLPETEPSTEAPTEAPDPIQELLESMSLEERVGQLFLARCSAATAAADAKKYHLGGYVLFGIDFESNSPEAVTRNIQSYQDAARIPLLIAVDEEGGTVTRVSRYSQFRSSNFPSPRTLYDRGGMELVLSTEAEKCQLLTSLGINTNLGPVCDITTNPGSFMYQRSLGQDADTTGYFISEMVQVMSDNRVGSVLKHFPGYGNNADTHVGIAVDNRSLEALEGQDLVPFRQGILSGADAIMISHTIVTCLDDEMPASLSPAVHTYLREEMGFDGVILTDDLVMDAITQAYGAGEAAVLAVLAGNDILCCTEYQVQYEAVLEAVLNGRIDYFTLTDAVTRILRWKQELGLL